MSKVDASVDKLSPELCDHIIDFLHDDKPSLRACALVSRTWVPACRTHLFNHLVLTGGHCSASSLVSSTSCRRVFAAIRAAPYLAAYIRKATIQESERSQGTYRQVTDEIMFPPLLKRLTSLRELEFIYPRQPYSYTSKVTWSAMALKDISNAMTFLSLKSLTIRRLSFRNLFDLVQILNSCRHLNTLSLDSIDTAMPAIPPSFLEQMFMTPTETHIHVDKKAELHHLLLRSNACALILPLLLDPRWPLDLSHLRTLTITVTSSSYPSVVELVHLAPPLEYLELEFAPSFDYDDHLDTENIINLSHLPSLKSISLQIGIYLARIDPLPWLGTLLSTAAPDNTIACLSLTCTIDKPPQASVTIQAFETTLYEWRGLDHLLTQEAFASLKRLRLDFALDNPPGDDTLGQIADLFVSELLGVSRRGILEVDVFEIR